MTEADARRILHVTAAASPAEIRSAYLDLVKVWHPDRFQGDTRLLERAQRTLQQINDAYRLLERGTTAPASPAAEPVRPTDESKSGAAMDASTTNSVWDYLQSPLVLQVCMGLAFGMALTLTFISRSTPEPVVAPATDSALPPASTEAQPLEPVSPAVPRASRPPRPTGPDSGTEIGRRGPAGRGALTIRSGLAMDAVVELLHDLGHRRRMYLRRGEQITLLDLVPGSYQLRFAAGTGWKERWFTDISATVERVQPVTVAQSQPGVRVESVALVFGDPGLRSTSSLQPD